MQFGVSIFSIPRWTKKAVDAHYIVCSPSDSNSPIGLTVRRLSGENWKQLYGYTRFNGNRKTLSNWNVE